jgi:trigger factor
LKIETTPQENQQVRVTVELDLATVEKYKHQAARKISQGGKIPGFRPGKAPYDIVRRQYGDDFIEKHAIEIMLDDLYPKILDESKIEPSGAGTLEDVDTTADPPKMTFLVPLKPEVTLGDYKSLRQEYNLEPVTDDDLDKVIKNLQVSYAVAEPAERPIKENDLVYFKVKATLQNPDEGQNPEIIKEMPYQVIVGELNPEPETWPYEGFSKGLIGLSANEEKVIDYTYPQDSTYDKLRGKDVKFEVAVQSVKELRLPELNDEFAKSVGEYVSFDDLKSKIKSQLEMNRQQEYDQSYSSQLIDKIVGISTVKFPPNVLEHEVQHVLEHLEQDLAEQKLDLETYLKTRKLDKDTFMKTEITPTAQRRLERSLVLDEVARNEKVEVGEEELQSAVAQTMGQLYNSPSFKKPASNQKFRELVDAVSYQTAGQLLDKHIIDRLKDIASGKMDIQLVEEVKSEEATSSNSETNDEVKKPAKRKRAKPEA